MDNDANLAGLAEWKFGAGRGHHNVLYLTVSTGVGGGVIINDRLLQGYHGLAAELGTYHCAGGWSALRLWATRTSRVVLVWDWDRALRG